MSEKTEWIVSLIDSGYVYIKADGYTQSGSLTFFNIGAGLDDNQNIATFADGRWEFVAINNGDTEIGHHEPKALD